MSSIYLPNRNTLTKTNPEDPLDPVVMTLEPCFLGGGEWLPCALSSFWKNERGEATMSPILKPVSQPGLAGGQGHVLVAMAWFWALNLIFFPTWLFGSPEPALRIRALTAILLWISVNILGLWVWLRAMVVSSPTGWHAPAPDTRQSCVLFLSVLALSAINLVPATHPLTSNGDEAFHAGIFRTMGRSLDALVTRLLPGPLFLWIALGGITLGALASGWWRLVNSRHRNLVLSLTGGALVVAVLGAVPLLSGSVERLMATALPTWDLAQLSGVVRFPPLPKFLWLPVSLCCWRSVFALRLPALVCWLLAGVVLHRVVSLRERSSMALLPALYLLTLPGMFYYAHLVYLTTPMLLAWCVALYYYECYQLSDERRYLIWTALALNIGTLVRRETGYFALGLLAHWAWTQWRRRRLRANTLVDGAGLAWFGLSVVPLWSRINTSRPLLFNWMNWLDPARLLAIANDYPYHLGPVATLLLLFAIGALLWNRRATHYSPTLLGVSGLTIGVTYLLYTLDWIELDPRRLGVIALGREWQTAHRFLVSWSPFVAVLLAEGIARLPWRRWRMVIGAGLVLVLLAQATVWTAPLTLPEFTSVRLRPGAEFPHLPADEVVTYVSTLATPQTKILLSNDAIGYYLNSLPTQGIWLREQWAPVEKQTIDELIAYCDTHAVNLVVLPLAWMASPPTKREVSQAVLSSEHFKVKRIFMYLNQPAIVVAEYIGPHARR